MNKAKFNKEFDSKNEHSCYNCGKEFLLSRAHIIRVSLRKDLEFDPDNRKYLCMDYAERKGCHNIWDDGTSEEILERFRIDVLREFLLYIKEKDILLFNRINDKLNVL